MSVFYELFNSPLTVNLPSLFKNSQAIPDQRVIPRKMYPVLAKTLPAGASDPASDPVSAYVHDMESIDPSANTGAFLTMDQFVGFITSFPLRERPTIYSKLRKLILGVQPIPPPPARPLQHSNAAESNAAQHNYWEGKDDTLPTLANQPIPKGTPAESVDAQQVYWDGRANTSSALANQPRDLFAMPQVNPFQRLPVYGGFEIIVLITTHGGTPVTCINRSITANQVYLPLTVDVTVMEASPCGVCSHELYSRDLVSYYKGVIDRNRMRLATDTPFLETIQRELRTGREGTYQEGEITPDESYSSEYRGWNILKDEIHVLEREYMQDRRDRRFCHMNVLYSTKKPFQTHQNLLDTHPIKYRSELISLLDKSGYTKILLLDLSCGVYEYESVRLDEAQDETRQRTKGLMKQGLAGGTRRRKRKRRSFRKSFLTNKR
jgi:hypothetical protein